MAGRCPLVHPDMLPITVGPTALKMHPLTHTLTHPPIHSPTHPSIHPHTLHARTAWAGPVTGLCGGSRSVSQAGALHCDLAAAGALYLNLFWRGSAALSPASSSSSSSFYPSSSASSSLGEALRLWHWTPLREKVHTYGCTTATTMRRSIRAPITRQGKQ